MRKIMGWSVDSIIDEYTDFARPKTREVDLDYIHSIQLENFEDVINKSGFEAISRYTMFRWSRMTKISILTGVILGLWAITLMDLRFY